MKFFFLSLILFLFNIKQISSLKFIPKTFFNTSGVEVFEVNGVDFNMVKVEGGNYKMGDNENTGELLAHDVFLNSFQIGETEVTQELFKTVMEYNPSFFSNCLQCPVERIDWYEAVEFCNKLSELKGLSPYYNLDSTKVDYKNSNIYDYKKWKVTINKSSKGFRLPTEAEWEYAARGGINSQKNIYAGINEVDSIFNVAWVDGNSGAKTQKVATKLSNELNLFDMSGSVWEWCFDWYDNQYYKKSPKSNPIGPQSGSFRVLRGGSWFSYPNFARVTYRNSGYPNIKVNYYGFRLCRNI